MKKLIIVNGIMGVGKTTTCNELASILKPCVFLDGDWCWMSKPFVVNEQTQAMVLDNITHLLRNFLMCRQYEYVIFCWVLHRKEILDLILSQLADIGFEKYVFTLTASPEALTERLRGDVKNKLREPDIVQRSLERMHMYDKMDTVKIDVSSITPREAASRIAEAVLWH